MTVSALLLYAFPVILWLTWQGRWHDPKTWAVALALGTAVDLLLALLIARVVQWETAVWLGRLLECTFVLLAMWRERRTNGRAAALPRPPSAAHRALAGVALSGLVALALSLSVSVPCGLWDRGWHIPLVASLRAERVPFLSVFDANLPLYYHYAGDAHAAMLQVLSFDHLHAATALARSHDVLALLFGLVVGSLVVTRAHWMGAPLVTLGALLTGPSWVGSIPAQTSGLLEALTNVLSYSFRPSALLGLIFALIWCAALFEPARRKGMGLMAAATAVLTLSDEVALASLGFAAGLIALCSPRPFGATRKEIGLRLITAALVMALCPLLFGGALSPGAEREPLALGLGTAPGFYDRVLSLGSSAGAQRILSLLLAPVLAGLLALYHGLTTNDLRERHASSLFVSLVVLAIAAIMVIHLGPDGAETVRFASLPQVLVPFVLVLGFASRQRDHRSPPRRLRTWASLALAAPAALLPLASTTRWAVGQLPTECERHTPATSPGLYRIDCRTTAGSHSFEATPRRVVADLNDFFAFVGCRPSLAVGRAGVRQHQISTTGPETDRDALIQLHTYPPEEKVSLVCREKPEPSRTTFCEAVRAQGLPCVLEGDWRICESDAAARQRLEPKLLISRPMPRGHLRP